MVYDYLVDLAELSEVLGLLEHVGVGQPGRQADHKDQILLHDSDIGQVFPVLRDLLLLRLVLLPLLRLDPGQLLRRQRLEVGRVLRVRGPAGRTQPAALRADLVPAEATYLDGKKKKKRKRRRMVRKIRSRSRGQDGAKFPISTT